MKIYNDGYNNVILCAGSNIEPRKENVEHCISWLNTVLQDAEYSDIYETPEIHGFGATYANAVIQGRISMEMSEFDHMLKKYEIISGRDEAARCRMEVPIDIDIVVWNGRVIREMDFRQSFFQIGYQILNFEMKEKEVDITTHNYQG